MTSPTGREAAETIERAIGRRGLVRAAALVSGTAASVGLGQTAVAAAPRKKGGKKGRGSGDLEILQPNQGRITGDEYLSPKANEVLWGYVPSLTSTPVMSMKSGRTVTIDTLSHEGILEDQGRDPAKYFKSLGVGRSEVLRDAINVADRYDRTVRNFDVDGPHVVVGPIFVKGAKPGDVLKIETLSAVPRVPYGIVSSRHGKGALAQQAGGAAPAGITPAEVMPPVGTDGRASGVPTQYGNVSVFTPVESRKGELVGVMDRRRGGKVRFPLNPFMGMMGVASAAGDTLTGPQLNSIPPTLGGGNIDIGLLGPGSTFYLPVFTEGALFYVGDPHMAMGDGEVALTAMEGSLRATFRLTVCKPGERGVPSVAYRYPFAETEDSWVPVGLSDPDGSIGGQGTDLDVAMRRAVVNALDFLQNDLRMERPVAYAYLSAASDFVVSQVVDRTVGVHGVIRKSDFE